MANIFADKECVAILMNNGEIIVSPADLLHSSCKVDITYYPFDIQTCGFILYPWGNNLNDIEFHTDNTFIDMTFFTPTGAWKLVDTNASIHKTYVYFEVVLERKPQYVMLNISIPFSFFNLFVFCIPVESGERISYCLTVLLSLAVFLTLVGQTLPKTSEPMSWFSFSLVGTVLTSIGITITVIFNMRLYYKGESTEVGRFWTKCMYCLSKRKSSLSNNPRQNRYISTNHNQKRKADSASLGDNHDQSTGHCSNVHTIYSKYNTRDVEMQTSRQENASVSNDDNLETYNAHTMLDITVTWKEITHLIDKIGFVFFLLIILCNYVLFAMKSLYRLYRGLNMATEPFIVRHRVIYISNINFGLTLPHNILLFWINLTAQYTSTLDYLTIY